MKNPISALGLAIVSSSLLALTAQPSHAEGTTFRCGTANGTPTTFAQNSLGEFVLIRWVSDYFEASGWTPETRCAEVTQRFQTYYDQGELKYLTAGVMNRQPVICTTDQDQGSCKNLLFTLKAGSKPNETLKALLHVRDYGTGALNETTERVYINMEELLSNPPSPVQPNEGSQSTNSNPKSGSIW